MRAHTGYYYTEKGEHNKKQCVRVLWPNCDKVTARPSSGWYFKISLQYNVKSIWTHTYTLQVISKYCRKEGKWAKRNVLKSTRVKAKYVGLSHHFIVSFSPNDIGNLNHKYNFLSSTKFNLTHFATIHSWPSPPKVFVYIVYLCLQSNWSYSIVDAFSHHQSTYT